MAIAAGGERMRRWGIVRQVIIQALLGHDKLDTTARYTRVATGMIAGIESPAWSAVAAAQKIQEEQESPAAGETADSCVPTSPGGRGDLRNHASP
jgi:hypothetical protein